jgi:uncharacterized protein YwgA/O-acetyl-ADP-ribose deacetylase (regulator of RNase III)
MVDTKVGNIFDSKSQTLINTVNCVGIMGKGIALGFKERFPDMYKDYVKRCRAGEVQLGRPYLYRQFMLPWVINFPTKYDWRSVTRLEDIERGMQYLLAHYKEWGVTSLAVPPLGCGEGQLEWRIVGPTMYRYLKRMDIPVEFYAPFGTPDIETQSSFLSEPVEPVIADAVVGKFKVEPDWVAIVEILARIEKEPYHWPIGRTTFQKIVYFATEAGLSTKLVYSQGSYGPFAPGLKSQISKLVNNGLINEQPLGNMLHITLGPTYSDARQAYKSALSDRMDIINRVANLFVRMRTKEAEIAATVLFSAKTLAKSSSGQKPSENEVLVYAMKWKKGRRPTLDQSEMAETIRNLAVLKWLDVTANEDLPLPKETEFATT